MKGLRAVFGRSCSVEEMLEPLFMVYTGKKLSVLEHACFMKMDRINVYFELDLDLYMNVDTKKEILNYPLQNR